MAGMAGVTRSAAAPLAVEEVRPTFEDVAERQEKVPLDRVREMAAAAAPPLDGYSALRAPGVGVIAEVKRASPSRGALAAIEDPAELAC